jgi:hypothetical protein
MVHRLDFIRESSRDDCALVDEHVLGHPTR